MSKTKRPNKPSTKTPVVQATPGAQATPVVHGDCFRTFLAEAISIGNEVEARRVYDADVGVYLTEKGLLVEFGAWREARHTPKP